MFPWNCAENIEPVMHSYDANRNGSGMVQYDAVEYNVGEEIRHGILQSILSVKCASKLTVGLVRRLEETNAEIGNSYVVNTYDNRRFKFRIGSHGDVDIDSITFSEVITPVMIIVDPWEMSQRHGAGKRVSCIEDTLDERLNIRFFELISFKFTSFLESYC
ncbi:hypothetical protein FGB62_307g00 [Gracilaria domingensis]|nr:hypothetical protein FGB62_307g00 [Gracilaria domingensis]